MGCLWFDNDAAPIFAMYVGPTKVKEIKLSTLSLLRSCFLTKQNDGVLRWPFKLYLTADVLLKVRLTHSMPLRPNKCIFLAFYVPSQIFLWEFQSPPPPSNKLTQPQTGMTKDIIMKSFMNYIYYQNLQCTWDQFKSFEITFLDQAKWWGVSLTIKTI